MLTDEIKKIIEELYEVTPSDVGVGYGMKIKDGEMTGDESIIFFVPQKKPRYAISEEELLPDTEFVLGDRILKTDVIEIGVVEAFACDPSCYTWQTIPPANRQYIRPIKGGISLTTQTKLGTVGTLGFIAVDTETQALVGVTNNHVAIKDASYTSQRNPSGVIQNEYDIVDGGTRQPDTAFQPGETNSPPPNFKVGEVVRYVPIYASGGVNKVDGALISVDCDPVIDIAQSFKQFGLSYNSPYQFATTAEINNLLASNPMLYSSGRTTGVKQGLPCPLRTYALGVNIPVSGYNIQGAASVVTFNDTIQFVRPENDPNLSTVCLYPIYPGDSGSALVANFGGVSKIIGLCFAGSPYYGFACRIDHVASELGIEAWDGTNKPYVDPDTIDYITVPGFNSIKTQVCEGATYWQVGATNLSKPCAETTSLTLFATYTEGSVEVQYLLQATNPVEFDYTISFTNILQTYTGSSITIDATIEIIQGTTIGVYSDTLPNNYNNLTTQTDFSNYRVSFPPNYSFTFDIVVESIFTPKPTKTPGLTNTPTPTPTPTQTPTPTPTPSPEPTFIYYAVRSCADDNEYVAKFSLQPPLIVPTPGFIYFLFTNNADFDACYEILGITVGPEDFVVLNTSEQYSDCSSCQG
jgi:hypothetical protein